MTGRTEIELALDDFLADGPETVPDPAVLRALDAIDRTKQRRELIAPWRYSLMISFPRLMAAMLVVVVAVGGGAYLLGQRSAVSAPSPSPSAQPASPSAVAVAPTVTPTPSVDTSSWNPFKSANYGFTVSHPPNWSEQPASARWTYAKQSDSAVETLWSPGGWPEFTGFETRIPAGMTADSFLSAYTADAVQTACYPRPNAWVKTTIDGHAANIAYAGCNEHFFFAEATAVIGNRIWFFDLIGPDRSLIVPFLSTVKIDPAKAAN